MTNDNVTILLTGATIGELAAKAMTFAQDVQGGVKIGKATTTKTKKTAAPVEEPEDIEIDDADLEASDDVEETTDETDEMAFDEDEVEEAPKKSAKTKAAKLTEKDVNTAALAHAKKHTRPKTLALLKKQFKVGSISELKPDQYGEVIKALKV